MFWGKTQWRRVLSRLELRRLSGNFPWIWLLSDFFFSMTQALYGKTDELGSFRRSWIILDKAVMLRCSWWQQRTWPYPKYECVLDTVLLCECMTNIFTQCAVICINCLGNYAEINKLLLNINIKYFWQINELINDNGGKTADKKLWCFHGEFCINMTQSQCEALFKQKKIRSTKLFRGRYF